MFSIGSFTRKLAIILFSVFIVWGLSSSSYAACVGTSPNGTLESPEECDDGNSTNWDGCSSTCMRETPSCSQVLRASIDKSNIYVGESITLTYDVNPGFKANAIFWGDNEAGNTNISSPAVHTYTNVHSYETIQVRVENPQKPDTNLVRCNVSPSINVSRVPGICGNDSIERDEECDDGDTLDNDGCSSSCQWETPSCSDLSYSFTPTGGTPPLLVSATFSHLHSSWVTISSLNRGDGSTSSFPSSPLTHSYTSLGTYLPKFTLRNSDDSSSSITCSVDNDNKITLDANCGNGEVEGSEQCDDGNIIDNDGCSSNCLWESPSCSNLTLELSATSGYIPFTLSATLGAKSGFKTDYIAWGDATSGSILSSTMQHTYATGGSYTITVYGTNTLNTSSVGSCKKNFTALSTTCGDGKKEHTEQCDDGNTTNGDGCSNTCELEYLSCEALKLSASPNKSSIPFETQLSFISHTGFTISSLDWGDGTLLSGDTTNPILSPQKQTYHLGKLFTVKLKVDNMLSGAYTTICSITILGEKKSSGGSGGGGGGGGTILIRDDCPQGDFSPSFYDRRCDADPRPSIAPPPIFPKSSSGGCKVDLNSSYSKEMIEAFLRAYDMKITTICPIEHANLEGPILRRHMAKMISEFAMKVLTIQPDGSKNGSFSDIKSQTDEMKSYIKLSYQLGVMGYKSDGITKKSTFDPNSPVSKAHFSTLLSRLLWGNTYDNNKDASYHTEHMNKLRSLSILDGYISDPKHSETRGNVIIMLYRAYKYKMKS